MLVHFKSTVVLMQGRALAEFRMAAALGRALLFVLLASVALVCPSIASAAEPQKRVLIISSVDPNLPAIALMNQAIRATLKNALPARVAIYNEVQDEFQIPNDKYAAEMVRLLRRKYEGERIDVIIVLSSPALKFLLKYKDELFSNTPIVFLTEDQAEVGGLSLGSNVTGVWGRTALVPNLDLMLALHPETERVVVVSGSSPYDKFWMTKAQNDFRAYESKVRFTYLTDMTIQKLRQELASQPKKSVVLFISFMVDSAGNNFSLPEALSFVAPTSSAPIYAVAETQLGTGVVGGSVMSYGALGTSAAELALRILAGEKPQEIAPQGVPNVLMFDWRELRRWKIDEAQLPPGSIVRYRQFTVWRLYRWRIIGAMTLIALQALGIIWLLFTRAKRRQAEEAKKNLAAIVETSDDAILSKSLEGAITSWNAGAEKMFGYSATEIVGQDYSILAPHDLKGEVRENLERVSRGESMDHLETVRLSKEGVRIDVSLTISPIKNERGRIVGASSIARDITARKNAEVEALRQRAEMVHLSRVTMLGELSSSLAHELNQPLGAILRNTEAAELFLQDPSPDLEELRAIVQDIRNDDQRAGAVIDRMRSLLKRREVEHNLLDLNVLVSEVVGLVRPDANSRKVQLALEAVSSILLVRGDRVQLQQVLLNLLLNAMDAVNERPPDLRRVTVRTQPAGTLVEVTVSDTGHGIPPDKFARLFEPFFTTKANGMGMGLPISRRIMEAHFGSIRAENGSAGGATFHFTLPVAKEESAS